MYMKTYLVEHSLMRFLTMYADYIFDFATIAISVGAFAVLTTIIHLFNFEDFKVLLSSNRDQ